MSSRVPKERADQISGGVFLIGLAILFLPNGIGFWPGILFVIGASSLARGMAEGQAWYSVQGALWMFGIGFLFLFGFNLAILLIIMGLTMLFGWRFRPPFLEDEEDAGPAKRGDFVLDHADKPKRTVITEDGLAYDTDYPDEYLMEVEDEDFI
jgi:hypothetical protein